MPNLPDYHTPLQPRFLVHETLRIIAEQSGRDLRFLPLELRQQVRDAWNDRFRETLEWRVGERISAPLSSMQRDEIADVIARGADAITWLDRHSPEHQRIVHDEMDVLVHEIASWYARVHSLAGAR